MNRLALHWQILIGMIVGAVIGITLNATNGTRSYSVPKDDLPDGLVLLEFEDSPSLIKITYQRKGVPRTEIVIDGTRRTEGALTTVEQLKKHDAAAAKWFRNYGRSTARRVGDASQNLGGLFLRLLRMVAVPLIVTSLLTGVTGLGHAGRRCGGRKAGGGRGRGGPPPGPRQGALGRARQRVVDSITRPRLVQQLDELFDVLRGELPLPEARLLRSDDAGIADQDGDRPNYVCNDCKGNLNFRQKHCRQCGEEIDWSGVPSNGE